jgi:hypothetical protein
MSGRMKKISESMCSLMHGMACVICFKLSKPFLVPFITAYEGVDVQIHIFFVLTSTQYAISGQHYVLLHLLTSVYSTVLSLSWRIYAQLRLIHL